MRLTQRLLLGALLVVGFLAALIVTVVDRQFTARLSEDATTFLAREARLVGDLWDREPGDPDALADRTGSALGRRVTLVDPTGRVVAVAEAACWGEIATARRGVGGFGYDPLFIVPEYHRTFGELSGAVKAVVSHRARALRAMIPQIVARFSPG